MGLVIRLIKKISIFIFSFHNCSISKRASVSPLSILRNTQINDWAYLSSFVVVHGTEIGPYCSVGPFSTIGAVSHLGGGISTSFHLVERQSQPNSRLIADVWVGAGVTIRSGVNIGVGAVIGAGAVVIKDVPDFAIVAGVPAKIIGYRFSSEKISQVLQSRYWVEGPERAKSILKDLEQTHG